MVFGIDCHTNACGEHHPQQDELLKNGGPSKALFGATLGAVVVAWGVAYSPLGALFNFVRLGATALGFIILIVLVYLCAVEIAKKFFYRKYGYLIEK